jgi:hypothetical protein
MTGTESITETESMTETEPMTETGESTVTANVYTSPDNSWSISYPDGWGVDDTDAAFVRIYSSEDVSLVGLCGIRSNAVSFSTVDELVDSMLATNEETFGARGQDYVVESQSEITLSSGLSGVEVIAEIGPGGKSRSVIVLADGQAYIVDCETFLEEWPKLEPIFDQIINSFTLSGEQSSTGTTTIVVVPASSSSLDAQAAPSEVWVEPADSIELFSPVAGGAYHSPLAVTGLSSTFQGAVSVMLVGAEGDVLAERTTMGGADGEYAFFDTFLRFSVNEPTVVMLKVVDMDMAEGTVLSEVSRELVLLPGQRTVDITYPAVGASVCGELIASGYSNTFEANVVVELRTREGELLEQLPAMGGTLGVFRDFALALDNTVEDEPMATLLSMTETDASGRYQSVDKTVMPLTLYPADSAECPVAG